MTNPNTERPLLTEESRVNRPIIGLMGFFLILIIIWNRAIRKRLPYVLGEELSPLSQGIIMYLCIIIFLLLCTKISLLIGKEPGKFLIKFYEKLPKTVSQHWFFDPGPYLCLLEKFFRVIENTIFEIFFHIAMNLLLGRIYLYDNVSKHNFRRICGNKWMKFLCFYSYYVFKFIPMVLYLIGLGEIYINYELKYFYNFLWLLLIPFIVDILLLHQMFSNYWKYALMHSDTGIDAISANDSIIDGEIKLNYKIDLHKEYNYYNITGVLTYTRPNLTLSQEANDELRNLYVYYHLRQGIARILRIIMKHCYTKSDIFIYFLMLGFFVSLLLY